MIRTTICENCGKEFKFRHLHDRNDKKYCSRQCYYDGRIKKHVDGSEAYVIPEGYRFIYFNGYPKREHVHVMEQNIQLLAKAEHMKIHTKLIRKCRDKTGKFIKSSRFIEKEDK